MGVAESRPEDKRTPPAGANDGQPADEPIDSGDDLRHGGDGSQHGDREINLGLYRFKIGEMAILAMVVSITAPAFFYSTNLRESNPSKLLVAICIGLFSAVVCLWVLDAVSVLRFRSEWVSRSVYGAAIVSVLGTSVAVYRDAFAERKYPYEGKWELRISSAEKQSFLAACPLVLINSEQAGVYYGYSAADMKIAEGDKAAWVEVVEFDPNAPTISVRAVFKDGKEKGLEFQLKPEHDSKRFVSLPGKSGESYSLTLSRPR